MDEKSILVVGDWRDVDFAAPLGWLDVHAACTYYCNVRAAIIELRSPTRCSDPAGILLLQSRPGEYCMRDIEALRAAAPLARLVTLVGPWCEGEQRTGRIWPGVVRVPWRAWTYRLAGEFGFADSIGTGERLPRTATDVERIERAAAVLMDHTRIAARAAVCTDSRSNFECLAGLLSYLGVEATWQTETAAPASDIDFGVFDDWPRAESIFSPETPAILLLHFPRPEDWERARAAGIAAVIAQPLLTSDLVAATDRALSAKMRQTEQRFPNDFAELSSR